MNPRRASCAAGSFLFFGVALGLGGRGLPPVTEDCDVAVVMATQPLPAPSDTLRDAAVTPPKLINRDEVVAALEKEYAPELRTPENSGQAYVWALVDRAGNVRDARLRQTSGNVRIDQAAIRVVCVMKYSPALKGGAPVPLWLNVPVSFRTQAPLRGWLPPPDVNQRLCFDLASASLDPAPPNGSAGKLAFTSAPKLLNQKDLNGIVAREYPPALRKTRQGGRVGVVTLVDRTGAVPAVFVQGPSGMQALDDAALRVACALKFQPALNDRTPVSTWISVPITFNAK
jgi:TonB family protein